MQEDINNGFPPILTHEAHDIDRDGCDGKGAVEKTWKACDDRGCDERGLEVC